MLIGEKPFAQHIKKAKAENTFLLATFHSNDNVNSLPFAGMIRCRFRGYDLSTPKRAYTPKQEEPQMYEDLSPKQKKGGRICCVRKISYFCKHQNFQTVSVKRHFVSLFPTFSL